MFANPKTRIGVAMLAFFAFLGIFGAVLAPYDPGKRSNDLLQGPSAKHWLGTTHLGQDIFSQILVGARSILFVGFVAGAIATVVSVVIGVSAGYLTGAAAESMSALANVVLVIPALPLIIIVTTAVPNGGDTAVALVIGFTSWAWGARLLRAQTLSLRNRDFVVAAKASGESTWRIIGFEILPNLTAIIAASFIGTVLFAVGIEVALAFIGVSGMSQWNWGVILYWAETELAIQQGAWWWYIPTGLLIALLGTALSLVNFGIDEIVNPRLRTGGKTLRTPSGKVRQKVGFTPVIRPRDAVNLATPVAAGVTPLSDIEIEEVGQ
jgi:peptide/nickel transport system permease protein